MLADADVARYDRDGYLQVAQLLEPEEVALYRTELRRLSGDPTVRADERTITEPASDDVRSLFEVHRRSPLLAELVADRRLLDRARHLLGSEVYVYQSRINYMPGFTGEGFYWHSDFETWHAEDGMPAPRACSISIALSENYPYNGGLMVMPGSHRDYVCCAGTTPADNYKQSLTRQQAGTPDTEALTVLAQRCGIEQFTGPAGSALVFDANLMHGSGNNITPYPRSNIFVVFNSVDNPLRRPYAAASPRPSWVAAR